MKKIAFIIAISIIITTFMFSCGGGGGGSAVNEVFTISYNANGAESGVAPAKQSGDEDSPQAIQANTGNLTKSGYLFDGWNTDASGSGTNYAPGASYKGKSITLYAKWAAIFNVQVITPPSPAQALNGVQRAPGVPYIKITGLTAKGRTLANINIPSTIDGYQVVSIGSGAFQNCDFVAELIIPETVSNIENNAFTGCTGLSTLTIPRSVTSIGDGAFSGCAGLNSLIMLTTTPPTMGTEALEGCTAIVSVPELYVDAYKASEGWNTYSASITGYGTDPYQVLFDDQYATTNVSPAGIYVTPPAVTLGTLPTAPARIGYIFGGWFMGPDGTGGEFTANTVVSGNITVYAKWETYEYTVIFDDLGATTPVGERSRTVASPNTTVGTLPSEPRNTGFYFGGWNTKVDGTGTVFHANTPVTSNITVYAQWIQAPTYTVTFDSQEATTPANPTSKQVFGSYSTIDSLPSEPSKEGFYFGGWNTKADGTGTVFNIVTPIDSDITVYAIWNSNPTYEVYFLSPGADTSAIPLSKQVISPATTVGSLPTPPVKKGYVFGGWFYNQEGTGEEFTASTVVTKGITLFAKWNSYKYTVTFDCQGATSDSVPSIKTVETPNTTIDSLPTSPIKTGYMFGGWYNAPEGAGGEFTADTIVASNKTVYAKWISNPTYTVTFDSQGATTAAKPTSKQVVSPAVTVGSLPTPPVKTGYMFGGWYNAPEGAGGEFTADTIVASNKTVYAKWINNPTYTVTFDSQEATTAAKPTRKAVVSPAVTVESLPTPPVKTGYIFGGWYNAPEGAGGEFTASTVVTDNITVYAKWNSYNYTVTFDSQGATTAAKPTSKQVASPATTVDSLPAPPVKTDYTFAGWFTGRGGAGEEFTTSTVVTKNTTVYAKWEYIFRYKEKDNTDEIILTGLSEAGKHLSSITIPSSIDGKPVTQIGQRGSSAPFEGCTDIISIVIPNSVTKIMGFGKCTGLNSITIPDSVTYIDDYSFSGCTGLTSITIPDSVTTIRPNTFRNCTGLTNLTIGKNVTSIGNNAFYGCSNLTTINYNATNCSFIAARDGWYDDNYEEPAFEECSKITTLNIGNNVEHIPAWAFYNLSSLSNLTISNSITTIEEYTFSQTGIVSVTIPSNVTYVKYDAFGYCDSLKSVTMKGTIPPSCDTQAFYNCNSLSKIYVPSSAVDAYKAADGWRYYSSKIVADE